LARPGMRQHRRDPPVEGCGAASNGWALPGAAWGTEVVIDVLV
jgi:hypothetical protein